MEDFTLCDLYFILASRRRSSWSGYLGLFLNAGTLLRIPLVGPTFLSSASLVKVGVEASLIMFAVAPYSHIATDRKVIGVRRWL